MEDKQTLEHHKTEEASQQLHLFPELYQFSKESTGLAILCAYLTLIFTSMTYLYFFYRAFDIPIVKYITLEDIIATPIKNPSIIFIFLALLFFLYVADFADRFKHKQAQKYKHSQKPAYIRFLDRVFWSPQQKKNNIIVTIICIIVFLACYVFAFAKIEYTHIKEGEGNHVLVYLADQQEGLKATLLGTSTNYLFVYAQTTQKAMVFSLESISSIVADSDRANPHVVEARSSLDATTDAENLLTLLTRPNKQIILLRHFEKQAVGSEQIKDVELTSSGHKNAQRLAQLVGKSKVKHIYSTDYRRTLQTILPTSQAMGIEPTLYDPYSLDTVANVLLDLPQSSLVVGHSNTTGELFALLGCPGTTLSEQDYNELFIIEFSQDQTHCHKQKLPSN